MGYFPNGYAHEAYLLTYCVNCQNWRHNENPDTVGCPIMDLHMQWNYDAIGNDADPDKRLALDTFIPYVGIANAECKMFLPNSPDRCLETPDMFGGQIDGKQTTAQ